MSAAVTRALAFLCLAALPAHAQTICGPWLDVLAQWAVRYGEVPRVQGLMNGGNAMVIMASETGGWTFLIVQPDGLTCIAAEGVAFEVAEPEPPGVDG